MARFDDINALGGNGPPKDNNPLLTSRVDELMKVFKDVNTLYIEKIAEQIQIIGEMNASSINRLMIMAQMNQNIAEIKARLQKAIEYTNERMDKIMQTAYQEVQENPNFKRVLDETPLSETAENRLDQLAKSISRQTQGTMRNISNTTLSWRNYRKYIDQAILAVTSGLGSYNEMTRWAVKELGYNGLQVQYSSGYHRRLDSAVRANIISAANQVAQQGSDIVKEDLGMNAVELTAHKAPAPDHAPVQGRVFLNAEFLKMQNGEDFEDVDKHKYSGFPRKIGEWNCMHMAMGFDTRYSVRKYTDEQLKKILEENEKGCTVNGKHYTMYQANQRMRQIETEVRRQKDVAVAAKKAGNESLQEDAQKRIDKLGERYLEFSKQSGLKPKWDRMNVEGFKKYKRQTETNEPSTKMAAETTDDQLKWPEMPDSQKPISDKEYKGLRDSITSCGLRQERFRKFKGDSVLFKDFTEKARDVAQKFPDLFDGKKVTLSYDDDPKNPNDFAETSSDGLRISLPSYLFRSRKALEDNYNAQVADGLFVKGTDYKSVLVHEMGHVPQIFYKIDPLAIAQKITGLEGQELQIYLRGTLSGYSATTTYVKGHFEFLGDEIMSEVFSEFFNSSNCSDFSRQFMAEVDKIVLAKNQEG